MQVHLFGGSSNNPIYIYICMCMSEFPKPKFSWSDFKCHILNINYEISGAEWD